MITDPFRGFRASQNLRAHGCSRHFCTFTSYRISQVFTKFPYQERIQIIFLTCGRGSRWYWFRGHGWPYLGWCGCPMVRQILLSMGHRYVNVFFTHQCIFPCVLKNTQIQIFCNSSCNLLRNARNLLLQSLILLNDFLFQ